MTDSHPQNQRQTPKTNVSLLSNGYVRRSRNPSLISTPASGKQLTLWLTVERNCW